MARHWYFKLLNEEKEINKKLLKVYKIEENRRNKQLSKQWKIDYDKYFDGDYEDFDKIGEKIKEKSENSKDNPCTSIIDEMKEKINEESEIVLKKGFEDIDEMVFFNENTDKMKYFKKFQCKVSHIINDIFLEDTGFIRYLTNGVKFEVSEVKLNKSMTVVYVYFILPELETTNFQVKIQDDESNFKHYITDNISSTTEFNSDLTNIPEKKRLKIIIKNGDRLDESAPYQLTADEKKMKDSIYKDFEVRLNKNKSKVSHMISQYLPLKYKLDIRFIKDEFYNDIDQFSRIINEIYKSKKKEGKNQKNENDFIREVKSYLYEDDQYVKDIFKEVNSNHDLISNAKGKEIIVSLLKQTSKCCFDVFISKVKENSELRSSLFVEKLINYHETLKGMIENSDSYSQKQEKDEEDEDEKELEKVNLIDEAKYFADNSLSPMSVNKIDYKKKSVLTKRLSSSTSSSEKEENPNSNNNNKNLSKSNLRLLMKYNINSNIITKESTMDADDITWNFSEIYKRDLPKYNIEYKDNKRVTKTDAITCDFSTDLRRIRKQRMMNSIQEKENKEILEKMMFKKKNLTKNVKKAIDFWRNLEKNY